MEIKNYVITIVTILQVLTLFTIMWRYTKRILPHIKEEHRSSTKLSLLFNTGIKRNWVDEEGWEMLKKQGWIMFFGFLTVPFVWILISIVW